MSVLCSSPLDVSSSHHRRPSGCILRAYFLIYGTAGGEMVLRREQLRCCATRPLREGEEPMLGYEEKLERLELLDAVADAGRLAKGLDQLLESLAHADQRTRSTSRASWP